MKTNFALLHHEDRKKQKRLPNKPFDFLSDSVAGGKAAVNNY